MKSRFHPLLLGTSAALVLALGTAGCAHHAAQTPPQAPAPPPIATNTPAEPAPPPSEPPAPPPPAAVTTPEFDPAFFDFNSDALGASSREALERDAKLMRENGDLRITIEGHCDERGPAEYNMALGERRAATARLYLIASGIASARIQIISYGKERPFVDGHDEEAWSKNRRAQLVVTQATLGGSLSSGDASK